MKVKVKTMAVVFEDWNLDDLVVQDSRVEDEQPKGRKDTYTS